MTKKGNIHYRVYVQEIIHDWDGSREVTRLLGETWAASAARAISNVKYRLGIKRPVDTFYGPTIVSKYYAENI